MPPENEGTGTGTGTGTVARVEAHNADDLIDRLLARYGNANAALRALATEQFDYRDRHRTDQEKIKRLEGLTFLKDGEVAVPKAEVDKLAEYVKLGEVAAVKKQLEEGAKADAENSSLKFKTAVSEVADEMNWHKTITADFIRKHDLEVKLEETQVEEEGKKVKRKLPYFKPRNKEGATFELATTFIEREDKDYLEVLEKGNGGEQSGDQEPGVKVPAQSGSRKGRAQPQTQVVKTVLGKRYKNPFAEKKD